MKDSFTRNKMGKEVKNDNFRKVRGNKVKEGRKDSFLREKRKQIGEKRK
jgi:hypothetical protein